MYEYVYVTVKLEFICVFLMSYLFDIAYLVDVANDFMNHTKFLEQNLSFHEEKNQSRTEGQRLPSEKNSSIISIMYTVNRLYLTN